MARTNFPGKPGGHRTGSVAAGPAPPFSCRHRPKTFRALWGRWERWLHADSDLSPLVRIAPAHVQFETIHPFLDDNGRIGRLLVEHWNLLEKPLLYLSVAFRRAHQAHYARLAAVRSEDDWESWVRFFLECVREAAEDGVRVAQALHALVGQNHNRIIAHDRPTAAAIELLGLTAPPTRKAIELLESLNVLREITGRRRGRVYAYNEYLQILTGDDTCSM